MPGARTARRCGLWLEFKRIPLSHPQGNDALLWQQGTLVSAPCPQGMLPALDLDGRLITESDEILLQLEATFGPSASR